MFVPAVSRLLEAVAKSIKHAMAMSTILTREIFQARRDAVLAIYWRIPQGSHRLEKYLKMKGSLEKSLKTKFVLKSP